MISVRKRDGESVNSLMYRFNKKVKQSGLVKEVRKRRFKNRDVSKLKVKRSALHRDTQKKEYARKKKLGMV
jgi:ribosomal protein S21